MSCFCSGVSRLRADIEDMSIDSSAATKASITPASLSAHSYGASASISRQNDLVCNSICLLLLVLKSPWKDLDGTRIRLR